MGLPRPSELGLTPTSPSWFFPPFFGIFNENFGTLRPDRNVAKL